MGDELHKYQKFLKLEIDRGFDNKAVLGGLEKIIPSWQNDAVSAGLNSTAIKTVTENFSNYGNQPVSARKQSVNQVLTILKKSAIEPKELSQLPENNYRQNSESRSPLDVQKNNTSSADGLDAPLTVVNGVGPANAQKLETLGLKTLGDLLYYFPRRYDDYSQLKMISHLRYGEEVTIIGVVEKIDTRRTQNRNMSITEAIIFDGTGRLRITWFNQKWITDKVVKGMQIVVSGKIDMYLGKLVMTNPAWEEIEKDHLNTNRIVPVYPLTARLTQNMLRKIMYQTVKFWSGRVPEYIPEKIRQSAGLCNLSTALSQTHFPENMERLKQAQHRLAFDEIFMIQMGVLSQKQAWESLTASKFTGAQPLLDKLRTTLPYSLTNAQRKVINEITQDLASGRPMNRLLQGDVGSGKTIVAAHAIAVVASKGAQSALMAPTSILAEQHYRNLLSTLTKSSDELPFMLHDEIRLLVGGTPENEKAEIREGLVKGSIKLVIGTHALLEDPVSFSDLELTIIDEQHRFGVNQRSILRAKGHNPHLLVMTATPIPRSLALTIYGDLDVSILDEMPPGRQPVSTHVLHPVEINRAYELIRSEIGKGRQVYIIYPLIETEDEDERKTAVDQHKIIQSQIFPEIKLGLLHGRMKAEEKDNVMADFRDNRYQILVSTTVIEVGVDIPNATVMMIEGANRFGLAQLHQLRGRVGRSTEQSYCLLIPENENSLENERLAVMAQTNDGFELAEKDLELRGPGQFLGTRQSGFSDLRMANLMDVRLIEKARLHAQNLFNEDPQLENPENQPLKNMLKRFWEENKGDVN